MDSNINSDDKKSKIRKLARVRVHKQRKNPHFRTTNSWRYKRVDERWRRPRGIDNKTKESQPGWPKMVKIGYRTPRLLRGLHVSGDLTVREEFIVQNISDLELVLPHKHIVRIGGNVGTRKKEQIYSAAQSWGIPVINPPREVMYESVEEVEEDLSLERDLADLDLDLDDLDISTPSETTGDESEDKKKEVEGEEIMAEEFDEEDK